MFQSLLLCAICPFVLLSSAVPTPEADETKLLAVTIFDSSSVTAILGGSLVLQCLMSLSLPTTTTSSLGRFAMHNMPRIKWSLLSSGKATEILVAQGERVKISELYKGRASLPNYASSPADLTLKLDGLKHSDSGFYRCEVQQGLEDAHDFIQIKVKGVVFHYRHASSRYAFTFEDAKSACDAIGAQIATPEQLLAAYKSGYEQCDAGWLADGSVRYPIHVPRDRCFGDMDSVPGIRNYGLVEHNELYDVYCYIENIHGKVFHGTSSERFTLAEAKAYCEQENSTLANTGQLYAAWNDGLNHCSPGWLADGSVRYPIVTPRERCGGSEPGVKTVYRYSNQTGFPEPYSRYDAYCFRGKLGFHTISSSKHLFTDLVDINQDIVTLADSQEEFSLGGVSYDENEVQGAVETFSVTREYTHKKTNPAEFDTLSTTERTTFTTASAVTETSQPARSSLKTLLDKHVPKLVNITHVEPNSYQPFTAGEEDAENSTANNGLRTDQGVDYQPTQETNVEGAEQEKLQKMLYTQNETLGNITANTVQPPGLFMSTEEAKLLQTTSNTNIDDENGSHEEYLVDLDDRTENSSVLMQPDKDLNVTFEYIFSATTESSTTEEKEVSTALGNTSGIPVTLSEEDSTENSTTDSLLFSYLSQSTQSFEAGPEYYNLTKTSSAEQGTINTATESNISDSTSFYHHTAVTIKPSKQTEKMAELIDGSGDDDVIELNRLTTPVPNPLWTAYSQKASTTQQVEGFVNKSSTPVDLKIIVERVEQVMLEELGGAPIFYSTTNSHVKSETISTHDKNSFEDESSGKEESFERDAYVTVNTSVLHTTINFTDFLINASGINELNESEHHTSDLSVEASVLAGMSLTASWEKPTPTPLQAFRADAEFSGDTILVTDNQRSSTESHSTQFTSTLKPEVTDNPTFSIAVDDESEHIEHLETIPYTEKSKMEDEVTVPIQQFSRLDKSLEKLVLRTGIVDGCVENPCVNGGTCVDSGTSVQCLCLPTYGGQFCQMDLEQCEPGWEKFQSNCYKHFSTRQSWVVAEQHCRMSGGNLVSVMSPEEQHFINDKYREYQWTGLNDRTIEGDFRWSDGNPLLYENWNGGQPDSYFLSGEDCVVMVWHDKGHWSDVPCNYHLSYTCKKGTTFCSHPPLVLNANQFGQQRLRYETNAQVRYYCQEGFIQRHNPIIRCQSNGKWEEPQITCTPKMDESHEDMITLPSENTKEVFLKQRSIL